MTNETKEDSYEKNDRGISSLLKVGLISAASAVAGGLAAAWWYRKTLNKLQNPISSAVIPKLGDSAEDSEDV